MRKYLPYILILVAIVFLPVATTYAQAPAAPAPAVPQVGILGSASSFVGGTFLSAINVVTSNLAGYIVSPLLYLIQKILALFMGLSGLILNYTLTETVVHMGQNISNISGINTAWKVIRDLMNIGFIFMLVYEGILMIIGQSDAGKVKKFITGIVLASLLINFSLFFTKILIDASNIVTIGMYNSIMGQIPDRGTGNVTGLSNAFAQSLGLNGFFSTDTINVPQGSGDYGQMLANLFACILFIITTFVFLAVSILFIVRFIVLIFLLAFSPIAYMGLSGLPGIATHSKKWWESLWGQLIFAPVYMLMTWVILTFIRSPNFFGSHLNPADFAKIQNASNFTDVTSAVPLIFNFVVVIGLTISSLIVAKSTATKGASQIKDLSSGLTKFAGNTLFGGAARFSRGTIGRLGERMANNEDLKTRAAEGSIRARIQLAAANRAAIGTFDVRGTDKFNKLSKDTGFGNDFGKVDSKKENYRAIKNERIKNLAKEAEIYKTSDVAVEDAKNRLNTNTAEGARFAAEEARMKAEYETFRMSPEYRNTEEFKQKELLSKEDEANKKIINETSDLISTNERDLLGIDDSIKALERNSKMRDDLMKKTGKTPEEERLLNELKDSYGAETKQVNNLIKQRSEVVKRISENKAKRVEYEIKNKDISQALKEIKENEENWMSDEKKHLIAISGGTKNKGGKIVDQNGQPVGIKIDSSYVQRMESLATEKENSPVWRWTANTLGRATNTVGITTQPLSRGDRQELAMKLRKQANGKSNKDKAIEAMKAIVKEDNSAEEEVIPAVPTEPPTPPTEPNTT